MENVHFHLKGLHTEQPGVKVDWDTVFCTVESLAVVSVLNQGFMLPPWRGLETHNGSFSDTVTTTSWPDRRESNLWFYYPVLLSLITLHIKIRRGGEAACQFTTDFEGFRVPREWTPAIQRGEIPSCCGDGGVSAVWWISLGWITGNEWVKCMDSMTPLL